MTTTTCNNPVKLNEITMESIKEASELLHPIKEQRIEVSKKHYKQLRKNFIKEDKSSGLRDSMNSGFIGELFGIPIFIRPYLKKLRLYTEK